jgi:hypothetical protein
LKYTEGYLITNHQKDVPKKAESKMDTKNHEKAIFYNESLSVFKIHYNQRTVYFEIRMLGL